MKFSLCQRVAGFALSVLFLFCLSSCGTMTEEIWVNADGSGRYEMRYDADEMLAMLEMMQGMEDAKDEEEGSADPQEEMMEMFDEERVDTLINLGSVMPDSIRDMINDRRAIRQGLESQGRVVTDATIDSLQNAFANIDQLSMSLQMDKAEGQLGFGMRVDFDEPTQITEIFGSMAALQALGGEEAGGNPMSKGMSDKMSNQTVYELSGNVLKVRQAANSSLDDLMEMMKGSETEMDEDQLVQALEMMGLGDHDVIVHVPGKIKSIDGASFTQVDDNTIKLTVNYVEMLKGGATMSADIRFKRKKKFKQVLPME